MSGASWAWAEAVNPSACREMKKGQVYYCEGCGVELRVAKECCTEVSAEGCACHVDENTCTVTCCDRPLKLRTK